MDEAAAILRFLAESRAATSTPTPPASPETALPLDAALLAHPALDLGPRDATGTLVLVVDPVAQADLPEVPADLAPWISGAVDRPSFPPRLRAKAEIAKGRRTLTARLAEHPEVRQVWADWNERWQAWSRTDQRDRPVTAFRAWVEQAGRTCGPEGPDELVLSFVQTAGLEDETVRHVAVVPVTASRDGERLCLRSHPLFPGVRVDLDALGFAAADAPTREAYLEIERLAADIGDPWTEGAFTAFTQALRAAIPPDQEIFEAPTLLRRTARGVPTSALWRLADRVAATGELTGGMLPLLSPRAAIPMVTQHGALVRVGEGGFCPGPLDATRVGIVEALDRHAQVVVHARHREPALVASLVTHLLAQGRRVLVTAPDTAALLGVRDHITPGIRPLVASTLDIESLGPTLESIVDRAGVETPPDATTTLRARIARIVALRRRHLIRDADDEAERGTVHEVAGHTGTVGELAARRAADRARLGWIEDVAPEGTVRSGDAPPPMSGDDLRDLARLLARPDLRALHDRFHGSTVDLESLTSPVQFATLLDTFDLAARAVPASADPDHPATRLLTTAPPETRATLRDLVADIAERVAEARLFPGQWMDAALDDVRGGRPAPWHALLRHLDGLLTQAVDAVQGIGAEVSLLKDVPDLVEQCDQVRRHIHRTGPIVVDSYGNPRLGVDVPPALAAAHRLAMYVRVDGRPPTTLDQLDAVLRYVDAEAAVARLDGAWPTDTVWTDEASPAERLRSHVERMRALRSLLDLDDLVTSATAVLAGVGVEAVDWRDDAMLASLVVLVGDADALAAADHAGAPLGEIAMRLRSLAAAPDTPEAMHDLARAAARLDVAGYERALRELAALTEAAPDVMRLRSLSESARHALPRLHAALTAAAPADGGEATDLGVWTERLNSFEDAWAYLQLSTWLADHLEGTDPASRAADLAALDTEIENAAAELATVRAWRAVPHPAMSPTTRVDLMVHAHLARRLREHGGTARRHAELRRLRSRARLAAPAWIAPLPEVADLVDLAHDTFDVVVVLDAGRVGLEGTFLRALASRIVFFGDDDSTPPPWADADALAGASEFLDSRPGFARWTDPTRSLFGDALTRGGARIILDDPDTTVVDALHGIGGHPIDETARSLAAAVDGIHGVEVVATGVALGDLHLDVLVRPTGHRGRTGATPARTGDGAPPGISGAGVGALVGLHIVRPGEDRTALAFACTLWRARGLTVVCVEEDHVRHDRGLVVSVVLDLLDVDHSPAASTTAPARGGEPPAGSTGEDSPEDGRAHDRASDRTPLPDAVERPRFGRPRSRTSTRPTRSRT